MGHFLAFLATALARGLVAEVLRHSIEPAIAERCPWIPGHCVGWTAILLALVAVEVIAFAIHRRRGKYLAHARWRGHERNSASRRVDHVPRAPAPRASPPCAPRHWPNPSALL